MKRILVPRCKIPGFGESGVIKAEDESKWPYVRLGPHTSVLPACTKGETLYVGLIMERKEILEEERLKIPSDFRKGRPDNESTATEILQEKTGIWKILDLSRFDRRIPSWPPNVEFESSRWIAWTLEKEETNRVFWFSQGEVIEILKRHDDLDVVTWHILSWIAIQKKLPEQV